MKSKQNSDMSSKKCFKCSSEKPLSEFYTHSRMADGHLGKCKECTKTDSAKKHEKNKESPEMVIRKRRQSRETARKRRALGLIKKYHSGTTAPHKAKAVQAVNNAIRDKRLTKKPCCICQNLNSNAHHEDYSKPLDVIWLCVRHHHDRHIYIRDCQTLKTTPLPFHEYQKIIF